MDVECPICKKSGNVPKGIGSMDGYEYDCQECGKFSITRSGYYDLRNTVLSERQQANIAGWIFEYNPNIISSVDIQKLKDLIAPRFHERAIKLLTYIEKNTNHIGEHIGRENCWRLVVWGINNKELLEICEYLENNLFVDKLSKMGREGPDERYKILPNGWAYLEELRKTGVNNEQCFVAMWFDATMNSVYENCISKGIEDAGYRPHRVDKREHNEKIDDEIIAQIKQSKFLIADFTDHRPGVYFEAGFAKGLGLEVIWACKKGYMKDLHFDIRQYNCIEWEDGKFVEFRKRIKDRIEAVLGRGTYTPHIH